MNNVQSFLRPNTAEIAAKVIDGEAILINLSSGIYYSLDGVGAFVWERIERGVDLGRIIEAVVASYDVSADEARQGVEKLVGELSTEGLIQVAESPPEKIDSADEAIERRMSYVPPMLNIYRDMGDLLALDPPMPGLADMTWKDPDDKAVD